MRKTEIFISVSILAAGIGVAFIPPPQQLSVTAMRLSGTFVAVILGLLLSPKPISLIAGLGLLAVALTQSLQCGAVPCSQCTIDKCGSLPSEASFMAALSGFSNDVNWLVFAAFHIGKGVEASQLGRRISLQLMRIMGGSILGLGYAIMFSELILGPFVPSNTARGGGIVLPIVYSIATTLGSFPDTEHSRDYGGEFLMLVGSHANLISASIFPTGMAANPFVRAAASKIFGIEFGYFQWMSGSIVPGLVASLVIPYLLYNLSYSSRFSIRKMLRRYRYDEIRTVESQDEITDFQISTETLVEAQKFANLKDQVVRELELLGPVSIREWKLIAILVGALVLWLTKPVTGLDTSLVAFLAAFVMLYTNVISWEDVTHNAKAWDCFFWLGILIMLANQLTYTHVSDVLGETIGHGIQHMGLESTGSVVFLGLIYFFSMYAFSSLTGHLLAFVGPFMNAGKSLGGSAFLITAILAYFSTLCGCLTNFSSGPVVIYFSQGYCKSRSRWFGIGLAIGLSHIMIYFTVGLLWWKILGWY